MDLDLDSAVVPTEDFVQALMDHMLDSFLPSRSSRHETPSLILQESVAQKMHVIVLLYNYYHRRQYPDLEFVDFESFWKLAVIIKPSLLVHSLHVRRCNANDPEAQRTIIEKAIMNACNICTRLGALKDTAITKKWPISKVAVFLFDSVEKRCFLTQGLSVIERGYDICNNRSEEFSKVKRKREAEGLLGVVLNAGEHSLEHLAFSAVKEATDINQEDLTVLESHDVYSLSEEERSTRFYLMKCSKSTTEDVIRVCIEDVIHSLQGPLVKKSFGKFMVGPAAEYLYLLPFADILTDWVSRGTSDPRFAFYVRIILEIARLEAGVVTEESKRFDGDGLEMKHLEDDEERDFPCDWSSRWERRWRVGEFSIKVPRGGCDIDARGSHDQ
ncbi:hypothetical protein GIB67_009159 [Kingdonia uniflora]|uniref:Uncharacterized protein n=1 Tax=Kingdonia uniflora TaxID=39325 RepID=A0A7J7N2L8_9MAGN|nr:hypothetical protein GIB67_009159 [Kingdonia uniflora]